MAVGVKNLPAVSVEPDVEVPELQDVGVRRRVDELGQNDRAVVFGLGNEVSPRSADGGAVGLDNKVLDGRTTHIPIFIVEAVLQQGRKLAGIKAQNRLSLG